MVLELWGERRELAGCSGGTAEAAPVVHLQGMVLSKSLVFVIFCTYKGDCGSSGTHCQHLPSV